MVTTVRHYICLNEKISLFDAQATTEDRSSILPNGGQTMATNQGFAKLTFSSLAVPLLAVAFLQPNTVFAQDDALVLEEIIVTAQRREQSLMDVP